MAFSGYREGFFKKRTKQTQYRKAREAEGTKIKTENREERREKKK
jgi:hypothetical protein